MSDDQRKQTVEMYDALRIADTGEVSCTSRSATLEDYKKALSDLSREFRRVTEENTKLKLEKTK